MSAEMRANTIPNLLKKMIAHVATSAVFVHSMHFVHVKCIKVYEATVPISSRVFTVTQDGDLVNLAFLGLNDADADTSSQ